MHTVSLEYAQSHLAELCEEAGRGENVCIANGDHVVRLVSAPVEQPDPKAGWPFLGMWVGKAELPEGWEDDLPIEMWEALKP
jgi:antitoxin (DNA-binding transcriptional repressor) of toxin-antitoxin stability system